MKTETMLRVVLVGKIVSAVVGALLFGCAAPNKALTTGEPSISEEMVGPAGPSDALWIVKRLSIKNPLAIGIMATVECKSVMQPLVWVHVNPHSKLDVDVVASWKYAHKVSCPHFDYYADDKR